MRSLSRGRLADAASVMFAGVLLNVAVYESLGSSAEKLALFAAVAIAAEALQRPHDELLPDALEGERFSLTAPLHVAAILVAGPWVAAAVAGWSAVAVGPFRGAPFVPLLRRGSALAGAALAGGMAFKLAGGTVGQIHLPDDLLPAVLAGLVYVTARTLLEGLAARQPVLPDLITASAEIGFGVALAYAAMRQIWIAAALAPVLLLVERLYARVVGLRHEMATALETFANIVDERDPSTHGHSLRVAQYVQQLARALGLPIAEVHRLWWAGRLHDLGNVAVDAAVLSKPGKLSPAEWGTVWRAPRLSARLLQRFRFANQQAQAVEFQRERYNGQGYYRVPQKDIPLAAHFLIIADAFDAMTTEKPFRTKMTREEALHEIDQGSGSQFHPVIARAFIALQRGQDPTTVLSGEELAAIRDASVPPRRALPARGGALGRPAHVALGGGGLALVGFGVDLPSLALAGVILALTGLVSWQRSKRRVKRFGARLEQAFLGTGDRAQVFGNVVDVVDTQKAWPLVYSAFVEWNDDGSGGAVRHERGSAGPPEASLISWLLREAESGAAIVVGEDGQLPGIDVGMAVPLRRENSALIGFLVLCGVERAPSYVLPAFEERLDAIGLAFAEALPTAVLKARATTVKLDPRRRRQPRTLEA